MRGRIAACSERLPRCEASAVSPQSSESALAGRRGRVPRRQETGGRRRQNRQYCGYFISALTVVEVNKYKALFCNQVAYKIEVVESGIARRETLGYEGEAGQGASAFTIEHG